MIDKTLFHLRYKLAQFLVADIVFSGIIKQPNFSDLSSLELIQEDKGFYLTALRLVTNLTQFDTKSEQDSEMFKQKIIDGKTLYFNKGVLELAANKNLTEALAEAKDVDELIKVDLFDTLVYQKIYNAYFMAFEQPDYNYQFLDDETAQLANSSIPINAFSLFDNKTLQTIEGLFDFEDNKAVRKVIKFMKAHEHIKTYTQFIALVERFAIVKK